MTRGAPGAPRLVHIVQGEEATGDSEDVVIATTLGSCVAVCLWDPGAGAGGMNHMLLPEMPDRAALARAVGATAMERLVNALLKRGAVRARLRAKLFGGASMIAGFTDIGARNVRFVRQWLADEGIPCDAEDIGGSLARQIRFQPATGRARLRRVSGISDPVRIRETAPAPAAGGLELL